jgi:hypothetical protein
MEDWIDNFKPESKEEQLALDVAHALNDLSNLACYISLTKKHPEHLIRRILAVVKRVPEIKIRKSRGALFNYLIQKNARQ